MVFVLPPRFSEETDVNPIPYNPPVEKVRQEKDFVIEKILLETATGETHDLTMIMQSVKVYTDLHASVVSGCIRLGDSNDLPFLMPLSGAEKITLTFTRPNAKSSAFDFGATTDETLLESIDMKFRIYRLRDRTQPRDKYQLYTLDFISEEFLKSMMTRMSRSFKGKTYSEMIQIIYDEKLKTDKEIEIEPTKEKQYFVATNKRPIDLIHQIANMASSDENGGSNFVFFQDTEKFRFVTLTKLMKEAPKEVYVYNYKDVFKASGGLINPQAIESDFVSVEAYQHTGGFNILDKLDRGMFASKLLTLDPVREIFEEIDFDYKENWPEFDHLDANDAVFDELDVLGAFDAKLFVADTNTNWDKSPYITEHEPELFPVRIEETLQLRRSQMQWIDTHKIAVSVSGDPRRKAGDVIEFKLPSMLSNLSPEHPNEDDAYISGKFLVLSCVHILESTQYTMTMEIVKDSIVEALEYSDPLEHYTDVY